MESFSRPNPDGYLSRLTIRTRLLSAYGLMLALMVLLAVMGWRAASYCRDAFETLQTHNVQGAVQLAKAESSLWKLRYGFPQFLVLGQKEREKIVEEEPLLYKQITDALAVYDSVERTPLERKALENFHEAFAKYTSARPRWFQLQLEGKTEEAATWRAATTTPYGAASVKGLSELIETQRAVGESTAAEVRAVSSRSLTSFGIVLALAVGLGLSVIVVLIRSVLTPLSYLVGLTRRAAEGDLTVQMELRQKDEIGTLGEAFATLLASLRDSNATMSAAVQQLASASAELLASTEAQDGAAQQQTAAVVEVNRTMQSLLESAAHISTTAQGVLSNAERSRETAELTAQKISELNAHTGRMSEVLEAIREIADRSDLLALNASLEGTRAGEAGRGFSLVAGEMRRLAERVTASVQDVKTLVLDVRGSGSSTVLVTEEARKLADNTSSSARQIHMVTEQQRTATEQVTKSMQNVSGIVAQAAAASQQTKAVAERLRGHAETLAAIMKRFGQLEPSHK